jgi:hypothetical protein
MSRYPARQASSNVLLNTMNSSSVPTSATIPASASRASWARRTWRGEATTGEPSAHATSACTIALPSCHGIRRNVSRSGAITKSP